MNLGCNLVSGLTQIPTLSHPRKRDPRARNLDLAQTLI